MLECQLNSPPASRTYSDLVLRSDTPNAGLRYLHLLRDVLKESPYGLSCESRMDSQDPKPLRSNGGNICDTPMYRFVTKVHDKSDSVVNIISDIKLSLLISPPNIHVINNGWWFDNEYYFKMKINYLCFWKVQISWTHNLAP